jgi:hypothetical protein
MQNDRYDIVQFLNDYPKMSIVPSRKDGLVISGMFSFSASQAGSITISDEYHLKIIMSDMFPKEIPVVYELDNKIPRDGKHHINPDDTLCLGSPLRLKLTLSKSKYLIAFAEKILVPFLYSMSHQRKVGGNLPADELEHGEDGIIRDYYELLKLNSSKQIRMALLLLGIRKRVANKKLCPCNCGKRYGRCKYRKVLEEYRYLANRGWFRNHYRNLGDYNR